MWERDQVAAGGGARQAGGEVAFEGAVIRNENIPICTSIAQSVRSANDARIRPLVGATRHACHFSQQDRKAPRHTVVLSHALGCDLTMWDGLANQLALENRAIAADHRGHGGSHARCVARL